MPLSKVALLCLESSSYFADDILNRREGVQKINRDRYKSGEFRVLYEDYRKNPDKFYEYTRLSVDTFDYVLQHIEPHFQQRLLRSRRVVTNPEKLFLTLRYLAHGLSFQSLSRSYRLGRSTVGKTIYQTLEAIWKGLHSLHLPKPSQEELRRISDDFFLKWQFPNCIGALNGKHFRISKPPMHGVDCSKRKKHFSLVLQGISDAEYKFIAIEVAGTFNFSQLNMQLTNDQFNVPPPQKPPGSNVPLPFVLVANESYPLKTFLMRPYPFANLNDERIIFNNRLSGARATVDCAFGVLSAKWRVFRKPLETNIKHATLIIKSACLLHNIVREKDGNSDQNFRDFMAYFKNRSNFRNTAKSRSNNRATSRAIAVRDAFRNYFVKNPI